MTDDDLLDIEKRLKAATPGPWELFEDYHCIVTSVTIPCLAECSHYPSTVSSRLQAEDNAAFIAHAPEDVAALIAEVKALRHRVEAYERGMMKEVYGIVHFRCNHHPGQMCDCDATGGPQ